MYAETRSVGVIGRDNGEAGITRFVYFRQKVQGGGAGLGVEESVSDKPLEGPAVVMRWWSSWL